MVAATRSFRTVPLQEVESRRRRQRRRFPALRGPQRRHRRAARRRRQHVLRMQSRSRSWRCGVRADLSTQRGLGFWAGKGRVDGPEGQLGQTWFVEVQQPCRDRVLGAEIGANHWRVVGVDGHRDPSGHQLCGSGDDQGPALRVGRRWRSGRRPTRSCAGPDVPAGAGRPRRRCHARSARHPDWPVRPRRSRARWSRRRAARCAVRPPVPGRTDHETSSAENHARIRQAPSPTSPGTS